MIDIGDRLAPGGWLESRVALLEARVKVLEDALRPFAEEISNPEFGQTFVTDEWWGPQVRLVHYRRAREALKSGGDDQ